MEAQILASMHETLRALVWHNTLLAYTLVLLTAITLVGFAWVGVELRALRALTAEVLRRTPAPE